MKFYFKSVFFAAALMAGFASCSNEDGLDNPATVDEGTPTAFSLVIGQPKTYATDATNATDAEVAINTIDVYIFGTDNVFQKRQTIAVDDFTKNGNVYTSNKAIKTTTGNKYIYVGVNLPDDVANAIPTQGVNVAYNIANVTELNTAGFAMFNTYKATPTTLVADPTGDGSANKVEISVARILSKVMVVKNFSSNEVAGGRIGDLEFSVGNINKKYFIYPTANNEDPNYDTVANTDWGNNFYHLFGTLESDKYKNVNEDLDNMKLAAAHYIMENTSSAKVKNDHTYANIRMTFIPDEMVTYNEGDTEPIAKVPAAGTPGDDFYTAQKNGKLYYFSDKDQAVKWAGEANVVKYTDGKCYYRVFLTGSDNEYNVLRNTIYKVSIATVAGIGKGTPGLDGGGGEEGGEEGGEDIDTPTNMKVEVKIENWNIENQEADL